MRRCSTVLTPLILCVIVRFKFHIRMGMVCTFVWDNDAKWMALKQLWDLIMPQTLIWNLCRQIMGPRGSESILLSPCSSHAVRKSISITCEIVLLLASVHNIFFSFLLGTNWLLTLKVYVMHCVMLMLQVFRGKKYDIILYSRLRYQTSNND